MISIKLATEYTTMQTKLEKDVIRRDWQTRNTVEAYKAAEGYSNHT
jgi:hypothetical protein